MKTLHFLVTLTFALQMPFASADLIAYYTFDGDGDDTSGMGNNGTVGASVTFDTDVPAALAGGQSIRGTAVNGSAGVVTVPNSASLETLKDTMTVSFWVKVDWTANSNWVRLMTRGDEAENASNSWLINRFNNNDDLLIRTDTQGGGGTFNQNRGGGAGTLQNNQWHHMAYVLDNGNFEEFVDGTSTAAGAYPHGTGFDNSSELLILGRGNGNLNGFMDEVAIWNTPLQDVQIERLAQGVPANLATIPEPSSLLLLVGGMIGLWRVRRGRHASI